LLVDRQERPQPRWLHRSAGCCWLAAALSTFACFFVVVAGRGCARGSRSSRWLRQV